MLARMGGITIPQRGQGKIYGAQVEWLAGKLGIKHGWGCSVPSVSSIFLLVTGSMLRLSSFYVTDELERGRLFSTIYFLFILIAACDLPENQISVTVSLFSHCSLMLVAFAPFVRILIAVSLLLTR